MTTRLLLVDDSVARGWRPFTSTRPAGEMLFGVQTLRARMEEVTGIRCSGYVGPSSLSDFEDPGCPGVGPLDLSPAEDPRLLLWSRLVLASSPTLPPDAAVLQARGTFAGLWLPPGAEVAESFEAPPTGLPVVDLDGYLLESVWELMARNGDQVALDGEGVEDDPLPPTVHRLGDGAVSIGTGVVIEPGVVIDTSGGPVILSDGVHVKAFTRIGGPAFVGPHSILLGGSFGGVSFGPECRMRGEVRSSVVLGYTNKAHDGFLGHSILGKWVNLGAMTTNSNLKNNYGAVRMIVGSDSHDTGMNKVGCFLGDHVKTGIGTLLNTGTVIEAASNLFGGAMPPKYVAPFSWGTGDDLVEHDLGRFLASAEVAMSRRGVSLTDGNRRLYEGLSRETTKSMRSPGG